MAIHEIKRNDSRPYWPVTFVFNDGTNPDLSSATVRFIARDRSNGSVIIDAAAVITDAVNGQVEYQFVAADTTQTGYFDCEWEVTFPDTTVQTFPTIGYDRLKVLGDLA